MEFFGLTNYGYTSPIREFMRDDYREPENPPENYLEISEKIGGNLAERRELDCYLGIGDGYSYRSAERLKFMRKRGLWKPVGPLDMFRYPGTKSMDYGWWIGDEELEGKEWYKWKVKKPIYSSEISRFVEVLIKTKWPGR